MILLLLGVCPKQSPKEARLYGGVGAKSEAVHGRETTAGEKSRSARKTKLDADGPTEKVTEDCIGEHKTYSQDWYLCNGECALVDELFRHWSRRLG